MWLTRCVQVRMTFFVILHAAASITLHAYKMSAAPLNSFEERQSRIVHQSPFERLLCLVRLFGSKLFASALNVSLFGTAK